MNLWVRHPLKMFNFKQGYCPLCNSSPPNPKCYVCRGSYDYSLKLTPDMRAVWMSRFQEWLKWRSKACKDLHPGESCWPGRNHPAVGL